MATPPATARPPRGRLPVRAAVDLAALALLGAACLINAVAPSGTARMLVTLAAALLVPGLAVMTRLPRGEAAHAVALSVALSVTIEVVVAVVMAWTGWWYPVAAAAILAGAAAIALIVDCVVVTARQGEIADAKGSARLRPRLGARLAGRSSARGLAAQLIPLAAAMALWVVSLPAIEVAGLGEAGLVGAAPVTFYIALGVLLIGGVSVISRTQTPTWVMAGYITGVVLVLYGTIPAISEAPQYAWTYKHIGVARLIEANGAVSPALDIYNRWPGMFALSAMFSSLTLSDAVTFAGWFELVFAWLQAIVVAAIALTVTRSHRVAAMSTLVWLVTNWIGQTYYSPQSLAYLLSLVMVLVILRQFALDGRLHARVTSVVGAIVRSKQSVDSPDVSLAWSTRRTIAIVLSLDVAIVVTHQLTPYIVALQVGVLTALGLRPRWLVVVCVALAVGYLLPNLDFVTSRYGLLSGLNPVENAQVDRVTYHRAWFYANVGGVLSYATLLLAALGGLRLARVGLAHRAIPVAALGLVPFAVIFGQSYGGEGVLRAFLFASPWLAILIAWGLSTLRPSVQFPAAVTMLASLSALFLFAFIGNAGSNVIPRDELDTSEYFYSTARPGSVLMLAGEDFPLRVGARYGEMAGPAGDHSPNLLEEPRFKNRRFVRRDLRPIARSILRYAPNGYLVFSTTQNRFARYYGTTPPGTFEELERWIADSPKFALWYSTPDSRIYRVRIRRCGFAHDCAASAARSRPGGTAP